MDVIFLIYLSKSFDNLWKGQCHIMYVVVLSEDNSILYSLEDLLSVCVRDCMGGLFITHSRET